MSSVTETLYRSLSTLPQAQVTAKGAQLVQEFCPEASKTTRTTMRSSQGRLIATDGAGGFRPVETAAFGNAFRFAEQRFKPGIQDDATVELACLSASVSAAAALAEARDVELETLFRAVGLGAEAYATLAASLSKSARPRGFDARVISAALAAIVACASIEKLTADQAAQALGLGSSAVTGNTVGYLPLQVAIAARDGILMALLVSCGFRGPPDPLACRWGVFEVFADPNDIESVAILARSPNNNSRGSR